MKKLKNIIFLILFCFLLMSEITIGNSGGAIIDASANDYLYVYYTQDPNTVNNTQNTVQIIGPL